MQEWKKKTITFLISQGVTLFGSSLVMIVTGGAMLLLSGILRIDKSVYGKG